MPLALFSLLLAVCFLSGGCATSALWEEGRFARYHEPAIPSNLSLSHSNKEMLVEYDESVEGSEGITHRAYWLGSNLERLQERRKPHFVSPRNLPQLTPIRIVHSPEDLERSSAGLYWAEVATNGYDFTIHSKEQALGGYDLPVYADASGPAKRVFLTPIAVVADLTIIGGYIFVWAWASSGGWAWTAH